jgi:hypothetical protein
MKKVTKMSKVPKVMDFYLFYIKKMEQSDTVTLGTLVHFSSL